MLHTIIIKIIITIKYSYVVSIQIIFTFITQSFRFFVQMFIWFCSLSNYLCRLRIFLPNCFRFGLYRCTASYSTAYRFVGQLWRRYITRVKVESQPSRLNVTLFDRSLLVSSLYLLKYIVMWPGASTPWFKPPPMEVNIMERVLKLYFRYFDTRDSIKFIWTAAETLSTQSTDRLLDGNI